MRMTGAQVAQNEQDKSTGTGKKVVAGVGVAALTGPLAYHTAQAAYHLRQANNAENVLGDPGLRDKHAEKFLSHAEKAKNTFGVKAVKAVGTGIKAAATVFKSDEENTMSKFGTDPLIKFWESTGLQKAKIPQEMFKVSAIRSVIAANIEHWATEEGAKEAVEYLDDDNGLRKAVYLDTYDLVSNDLAKADGAADSFIPDIAQYAEYTLNKSYPTIVDVDFKTTASSAGQQNGNGGTPASGASSSYGTPTPPNTSASSTYGKVGDDGAQKAISTAPKVEDPALTTRQGKGRLLANYAAAFKQAKANPIQISPTSRVDEKYPAPNGTDLDTTKGTSLTRAEGATDLQKSIAATIAGKLRDHADELAAAVQGGAHGIKDAAGRLNKSGFAARVRGAGPKILTGAAVAAAGTGIDAGVTVARRDSTTNPANN